MGERPVGVPFSVWLRRLLWFPLKLMLPASPHLLRAVVEEEAEEVEAGRLHRRP